MTHSEYITLVNTAKRYNFEYYVLSKPSISDADFDHLLTLLEDYETAHPDKVLPDSPTQQVGSDLAANGRRLVRHRTPMLSCQKATTTDKHTALEAVEAWFDKSNKKLRKMYKSSANAAWPVVVMWKYDGISCSLVYQDGALVEASTRGDGQQGQDILAHVMEMPSVPQRLNARCPDNVRGRIEVRGEIVCPKAALGLLAQKYADCRTAASSLCNMAFPSVDMHLLEFYPWDALFNTREQSGLINSDSMWQKFDILADFGFNLSLLLRCRTFADVKREISEFEASRDAYPFPTDGVVIRMEMDDPFFDLGATAHHPHGSIAYKFAPAKATTRCTRVEVTVGKTGRRTPVAHFEPVVLNGRTLTKASLGSEAAATRLGIAPGATIEVGLANDVTPKVYRVVAAPVASPTPSAPVDPATPAPTDAPTDEESPVIGGVRNHRKSIRTAVAVAVGALVCAAVCVVGIAAVGAAAFLVPVLAGGLK